MTPIGHPERQVVQDQRALRLALAVYLVVFILKLAAYVATDVTALLAEALHSLSDVFLSGFLLVATIWSRREADATHMFGHARAQNVAALVAATLLISFTSLQLYEEAIPRLLHPEQASYQRLPLAAGVLVISMLVEAVPLLALSGQRGGAAVRAQRLDLVNDELGLVAALAGTLFIAWGKPVADPIAALVVATVIAANAVRLFRENASLLVGSSPGPEYMARLERTALSVPGVLDVHDLRAVYIGPDTLYVGMHIRVRGGQTVEDADRISERVAAAVERLAGSSHVMVHLDTDDADARRSA